jgi:hypothetical protein
LRALGKLRRVEIAARLSPPGKIFRIRQKLPGGMGKYFHFSEKFHSEKPAKPRKILVHAGTGHS